MNRARELAVKDFQSGFQPREGYTNAVGGLHPRKKGSASSQTLRPTWTKERAHLSWREKGSARMTNTQQTKSISAHGSCQRHTPVLPAKSLFRNPPIQKVGCYRRLSVVSVGLPWPARPLRQAKKRRNPNTPVIATTIRDPSQLLQKSWFSSTLAVGLGAEHLPLRLVARTSLDMKQARDRDSGLAPCM